MGLKTASQNAKLQYEASGRSPPGFHPPVCRFRSPASFLSEMATFQIWDQTVKTGGATPENVVFPLFSSFSELALFHVYIFVPF